MLSHETEASMLGTIVSTNRGPKVVEGTLSIYSDQILIIQDADTLIDSVPFLEILKSGKVHKVLVGGEINFEHNCTLWLVACLRKNPPTIFTQVADDEELLEVRVHDS